MGQNVGWVIILLKCTVRVIMKGKNKRYLKPGYQRAWSAKGCGWELVIDGKSFYFVSWKTTSKIIQSDRDTEIFYCCMINVGPEEMLHNDDQSHVRFSLEVPSCLEIVIRLKRKKNDLSSWKNIRKKTWLA